MSFSPCYSRPNNSVREPKRLLTRLKMLKQNGQLEMLQFVFFYLIGLVADLILRSLFLEFPYWCPTPIKRISFIRKKVYEFLYLFILTCSQKLAGIILLDDILRVFLQTLILGFKRFKSTMFTSTLLPSSFVEV